MNFKLYFIVCFDQDPADKHFINNKINL